MAKVGETLDAAETAEAALAERASVSPARATRAQRRRQRADTPSAEHEEPSGEASPPTLSVPYRRVLGLLAPYWGRLLAGGVLLALTSLVALVLPLGLQRLIDQVIGRHDGNLLNIVTLALIALFILRGILDATQNYLISSVGQRMTADLRVRLFHHLERLSLRFYDERRVGETLSRVTNDVTLIATLNDNIVPLAGQVVTLIGSVIIVVALNWRLTLIVLLVAPPAALIASGLARRIWSDSTEVQEALAQATGVLDESLGSIRVVKSFAREGYELGRFSKSIGSLLRVSLRRARIQAFVGPIVTFIGFLAVIIVIWFGGREALAGRLSVGQLVAFVIYLIIMIVPLATLSGIFAQTQAALAAAARVFAVLDEPIDASETSESLPPIGPIQGRVTFDRVEFAYAPNRQVLRGVSFDVAPGKVVALVGPSGAGKTTTLQILLRLYELTGGAIRVDDVDITTVAIRSLREQMAIVPQEPTLFSGSIADNIRFGRLNATDADVETAAHAANAHEFISRLPEGYRTLVGERGVKLSAGQRQRVAIARAILRDPRILLLDEATASLDNVSEALVQQALSRLMAERTTVVVAHRLTTIERADAILVLDRGVIIEQGTHEELLAREGLYAQLYTRSLSEEFLTEEFDEAPLP